MDEDWKTHPYGKKRGEIPFDARVLKRALSEIKKSGERVGKVWLQNKAQVVGKIKRLGYVFNPKKEALVQTKKIMVAKLPKIINLKSKRYQN